MGYLCFNKSVHPGESGKKKMGCLFCCRSSKETHKKSSKEKRKWNPLACMACRAKRIMCCSSCSGGDKPSEESMIKEKRNWNPIACMSGTRKRMMCCSSCCCKGDKSPLDENKEEKRAGNPLVVRRDKPLIEEVKKPTGGGGGMITKEKRGMACYFCCAKSSEDQRKSSRKSKETRKRSRLSCLLCRGKCFRCCGKSSDPDNKKSPRKKKETRKGSQLAFLVHSISFKSEGSKHRTAAEEILRIGNGNIAARVFQFRELTAATKNFKDDCLLGEGGFGRVYKGNFEDTNQIVAVKQLDRNGFQGNREFLIEVLMLSLLHHKNLVNLLGYCADGDQRILVYEYMPLGSLEDHLFAPLPKNNPLDWNIRMRIALGAAKGLEYLHHIANPPVIYRDFKPSNILLDDEYNPKLSDFGLAKLGPVGDKSHVSTRVMGTYGYCAPEYALTGQLTKMSDVYSFGVVFLEIITGRRAIDISKPTNEQQLVQWAGPLFKDKSKFVEMVDPLLQGKYPLKGLYHALAVASMCLQDEANIRPRISDVVTALEYLAIPTDDPSEGLQEYTPQELPPSMVELETNDTDGRSTRTKEDML